jgi:hypothetical protein
MSKQIKQIKHMAAQGDVMIIRVGEIPEGLNEVPRVNGKLIVTHSETGHHHTIERPGVRMYQDPTDPLSAWLEVHGEENLPNLADLIHERSYDTHETISIPPGKYKIRRQREHTPEGWQQVQD